MWSPCPILRPQNFASREQPCISKRMMIVSSSPRCMDLLLRLGRMISLLSSSRKNLRMVSCGLRRETLTKFIVHVTRTSEMSIEAGTTDFVRPCSLMTCERSTSKTANSCGAMSASTPLYPGLIQSSAMRIGTSTSTLICSTRYPLLSQAIVPLCWASDALYL